MSWLKLVWYHYEYVCLVSALTSIDLALVFGSWSPEIAKHSRPDRSNYLDRRKTLIGPTPMLHFPQSRNCILFAVMADGDTFARGTNTTSI